MEKYACEFSVFYQIRKNCLCQKIFAIKADWSIPNLGDKDLM